MGSNSAVAGLKLVARGVWKKGEVDLPLGVAALALSTLLLILGWVTSLQQTQFVVRQLTVMGLLRKKPTEITAHKAPGAQRADE